MTIQLKRDLPAKLWWGTGAGIGAAIMALLLGFSLVTNLSFYLEAEAGSIVVFCVFLVMLGITAIWLTGRIELREHELVAGSRLMPQRFARDEIAGVRIAQIEPLDDSALGVQVLIHEEWTNLRLGAGLHEDQRMDWARLISGWSGCDVLATPDDLSELG